MHVKVAGRVAHQRNVGPVITFQKPAVVQNVLKSPQLMLGRQQDRLPVSGQPHGAIKRALKNGNGSLPVTSNEDEFPSLIRADGEGDALLAQPIGKSR